jgi:hypothetical protein
MTKKRHGSRWFWIAVAALYLVVAMTCLPLASRVSHFEEPIDGGRTVVGLLVLDTFWNRARILTILPVLKIAGVEVVWEPAAQRLPSGLVEGGVYEMPDPSGKIRLAKICGIKNGILYWRTYLELFEERPTDVTTADLSYILWPEIGTEPEFIERKPRFLKMEALDAQALRSGRSLATAEELEKINLTAEDLEIINLNKTDGGDEKPAPQP